VLLECGWNKDLELEQTIRSHGTQVFSFQINDFSRQSLDDCILKVNMILKIKIP
jgi:hypothetical protein